MITSVAAGFMAMLCAACATPSHDPPGVTISITQPEHVQSPSSSEEGAPTRLSASESGLRLAAMNSDLGQPAWSDFQTAAHLGALALTTPRPIHNLPVDSWSANILLGASAERTGLGLDFTFVPRAEIERGQTGHNTARAGVEFRLGADLLERDQRGTNAPAPSWYFFVGAENEALVWNVADTHALTGVALRDQATVGDLQAGIAWTMKTGGQMSFGLVEREIKFDDATGENDVHRTDRFAALSFTLHH